MAQGSPRRKFADSGQPLVPCFLPCRTTGRTFTNCKLAMPVLITFCLVREEKHIRYTSTALPIYSTTKRGLDRPPSSCKIAFCLCQCITTQFICLGLLLTFLAVGAVAQVFSMAWAIFTCIEQTSSASNHD